MVAASLGHLGNSIKWMWLAEKGADYTENIVFLSDILLSNNITHTQCSLCWKLLVILMVSPSIRS